MTITEREVGDVTILDINGKITIGEGDEDLEDKIKALSSQAVAWIIVNFKGCPYVDSSGLGATVRGMILVTRLGGKLKLLNIQKQLRDLLTITKLMTVFEVFDDEAEAVRSFQPVTTE